MSIVHKASRRTRQDMVRSWAIECFGEEEATSPKQRALRFLEEAIELYQAVEGDEVLAQELMQFIFDRPKGGIHQEIGGVSVTLLALADSVGEDCDTAEADEIFRLLNKPRYHFTKRNEAKKQAGFVHL